MEKTQLEKTVDLLIAEYQEKKLMIELDSMISVEARKRLVAVERLELDRLAFFCNLYKALRPHRDTVPERERFSRSLNSRRGHFPPHLQKTVDAFLGGEQVEINQMKIENLNKQPEPYTGYVERPLDARLEP